jgi:hypothetical protein
VIHHRDLPTRRPRNLLFLVVGLICALHLTSPDCRAKETSLPPTLKPGDVVTFVDANGQRIDLTVAKITPQTKPDEPRVQPETVKKKEQPKRTAGSDQVAGDAEKIPPSEQRFRKLSTEFAVPDSPAAHVLGVAPEKVIHAETPKQLVTALINGLDENGNLQSGFAIDFAPMQIYLGRDRNQQGKSDLQVYASGSKGIFSESGITQYFLRVLGRTQLSFATVRGSSEDDKSGKLALGLHTTFIDAKDRVLLAGLTDIRGPELQSLSGPTLQELAQNYGETASMARARFREDALGKVANFLWDHASWSMGAAPAWLAEDAESGNYKWNGLTAWSTFTLSWKPTEQSWLWPLDFLFHFRYRSDEKIPIADALPLEAGFKADPAEKFVNQDSWLAVAGLRLGRKDFFVTGTATYTNLRQDRRGSDDTFQYTVALEKKISSGTWLSLSVGTETGSEDKEKPLLVLAGVKLGLDGESFSEH